MTAYSKKKPAKIMINGWRSEASLVGELKMLELSELDKHGDDFIKAELMDSIIRLGMGALKDGKVVTPMDMMIATTEPVKPKRAPVKRFVAPTIDEVFNHMCDNGASNMQADAESQAFVNYWSDMDWKRKGQKMKSWKGSAANWVKNDYGSKAAKSTATTQRGSMPDRTAEYEALGLIGNDSGNAIAGELA